MRAVERRRTCGRGISTQSRREGQGRGGQRRGQKERGQKERMAEERGAGQWRGEKDSWEMSFYLNKGRGGRG